MGDVATLQGEVLAILSQYKSAWNDTAQLLNEALKNSPLPVTLLPLARQYPAYSAANCVNEINAALQNADGQLKKLVRDIGLEKHLPMGPGAGGMVLLGAISHGPRPRPGMGPGANEMKPEEAFGEFIRRYARLINAATVSLQGVCDNIKNRAHRLDDRYVILFSKSRGRYYVIDGFSPIAL